MKALPNILSVFRILLVPVFIIAYFSDVNYTKVYAILIYALAALSDFFDGFLARRFKAASSLGKFLDPLGDKLMTFSAMVCITIDGIIPVWAVVAAGLKEILMGVGGFILYKVAHVEIPPSNMLGKASTIVFFLVCGTLMLFRDLPGNVAIALISTAIVLMFLALASYVNTYVILMKRRDKGAGL